MPPLFVCENFGGNFFCWQVKFLIFFHGGFTPKPPTAERGGANFWRLPQLTAPLFSATDERAGRMGVWGLAPIIKLYQAIIGF